jgi:Ca2+-dependent lipid-binding protein
VEVHRTEQIKDNLNPDFTKSMLLDFIFEKHQFLKIECRDIDNDAGSQFDDLGFCEFELGTLMGSRKNMLILPLSNGSGVKQGDAVIRSEKVSNENYSVSFLYLHQVFN